MTTFDQDDAEPTQEEEIHHVDLSPLTAALAGVAIVGGLFLGRIIVNKILGE